MKRFQRRRLAAETLENRALLAGDITASVEDGVLTITGDAEANGVLIRQSGSDLEVVGVDAGGSATTINGDASFLATGVTDGAIVFLKGGDDTVQLGDGGVVSIDETVVIGTGAGNDEVTGSLANDERAIFLLGAGDDSISLEGSALHDLVIVTDHPSPKLGGSDDVTLESVTTTRAGVIVTGGGDDTVDISGESAFGRSLTIATGRGSDTVNLTGAEDASLTVGRGLNIVTGRGDDTVNAQFVQVTGSVRVSNLDGAADITLDHVEASDRLFANLGKGDDALTISNSSAERALLNGGKGADALTLDTNTLGRVRRVSI